MYRHDFKNKEWKGIQEINIINHHQRQIMESKLLHVYSLGVIAFSSIWICIYLQYYYMFIPTTHAVNKRKGHLYSFARNDTHNNIANLTKIDIDVNSHHLKEFWSRYGKIMSYLKTNSSHHLNEFECKAGNSLERIKRERLDFQNNWTFPLCPCFASTKGK